MSGLPDLWPSGLASSVTSEILGSVLSWLGSGVSWLVGHVVGAALASTTAVDVTGPAWKGAADALLPVGGLLVLPLLGVATVGAVLRQDARRLARTWAVGLPAATLGGAVAVALTALGVQVADALCRLIEGSLAPNLGAAYGKALAATVSAGPPGAATAVVLVVFLLGAVALWLELVLRAAAVQLAVLFLPLGLAGLVWPATAHWAKRLAEVLGALLLSKVVVVAALCLGARAIGRGTSVDDALTASAILLLAAFAPFSLFKLIPLAEGAAIAHFQGLSRQPLRAVTRVGGAAAGRAAGIDAGNPFSAPVAPAAQSGSGASPAGPTPWSTLLNRHLPAPAGGWTPQDRLGPAAPPVGAPPVSSPSEAPSPGRAASPPAPASVPAPTRSAGGG
jgi:hypothetical protein